MTPVPGVFPLFRALFFLWATLTIVVGLPDSEGLVRRDVPRVEIVARSGDGELGRAKLGKRGNASVEYLRYTTQSYNALASIGPYSFLLSLDTASSDTWVISSACHSVSCRGLPTYSANLFSPSFTSVADNLTAFHVGFADGTSADGFVARENLGLGGFLLGGQVIGLVNDTNVTLASGDVKSSGVLALGFPRLSQIGRNVPGAVPAIARLAQQGDLSYPMFGLNLRKNDTGTLSLGAIDVDIVSNLSSIAWHNVAPFPTLPTDNSSVYLQWAIHMSGVSVGSQRVVINSTYPRIVGSQPLALLDLGTNGMFGPAASVANLFSLIPASRLVGDGQYAVPCDTTLNMNFTFGARNYTLRPHDYIFAPVEDPPNMCLAWPRATPPSSDGIDWQLGTPFLRTVYSVFSYGIDNKEPPKIGLYPLPQAAVDDTPEIVSYSLSAESATFATTLPNFVLPTLTYTTPPYLFSPSPSPTLTSAQSSTTSTTLGSSISTSSTPTFIYSVPTLGQLEHSGLGASTYSPLITRSSGALLPTARVSFAVVTDSSGAMSTQPMAMQTAVLGGPEENSGHRLSGSGGLWAIVGLCVLMYVIV
ncbi:hypothetical protein FS749_014245 [Ceratobasidium sp. UAMH 11750]|nr:hypothetical protein FS749_014245 [Ceratobasidium sp. UAMH 11750]